MIVGENIQNKFTARVLGTDRAYSFYYRVPEIDEWLDYNQGLREALKIKDEKEKDREIVKYKVKFACGVLQGIEEGQFEIEIDGNVRPLSSDPGSPNFHEGWKALLEKQVYFLLVHLADAAFQVGGAAVEKK